MMVRQEWGLSNKMAANVLCRIPMKPNTLICPCRYWKNMEVDHCVSLKKMGNIIGNIIKDIKPKNVIPSPLVKAEAQNYQKGLQRALKDVTRLGEKTIYACPDCGGGLVENG